MSEDRVSNAVASVLGRSSTRARILPREKGIPINTGIGVLDKPEEHRVRLGELVEFVGVSTAGKTVLLHTVAATALLNAKSEQKPVVCWFDLNGGFDLSRLMRIIGQPSKNMYGIQQRQGCDPASGLILYYPESTLAMCSTLHAMPSFLSTDEGSNGTSYSSFHS